jgi:hypothetical protein
MHKIVLQSLGKSLTVVVGAALFVACSDTAPVAPDRTAVSSPRFATLPAAGSDVAIAALQRVTARYHELDVAKSEGFVLLHECESRPGEGPVGVVYVNLARLLDGVIDPEAPDALIYAPGSTGPRLAGVEFAIPYALWTNPQPPQFLGATFQREDEFGVFALHAWVWLNNPDGLFAETNPRVSCSL